MTTTSIKIGDTLNLSGSTRLIDMTTLRASAKSGSWATYPATGNNPAITMTSQWGAGLADTLWQTTDAKGDVILYWSKLGAELELYPNAPAMKALGSNPFSVDASGDVVIQPRLLTAAEKATNEGQSATASAQLLSGAMTLWPASISPPYVFYLRAKVPGQMGEWPAFWALASDKSWPPELDVFEGIFPTGNPLQFTTSIHTNDKTWAAKVDPTTTYISSDGSTATETIPNFGQNTGLHDYHAVVYPDITAIFIDEKCVKVWPTPSDFSKPFYPIINYAIGGPGDFGGTPPNLNITFDPFVIADVGVYAMPATYVAGAPPAPTIFITPGSGSFKDAAGNTYTLTAGFIAMENGSPIPNGDGTSEMAFYNGAVYAQDKGTLAWYTWTAATGFVAAAAPPANTNPPPPSNTVFTAAQVTSVKNAAAVFTADVSTSVTPAKMTAMQTALTTLRTTLGLT